MLLMARLAGRVGCTNQGLAVFTFVISLAVMDGKEAIESSVSHTSKTFHSKSKTWLSPEVVDAAILKREDI
jgi:hypothetical protein